NRHDVNHDGVIDMMDTIPETPAIPSLRPLGVLTKTSEESTLGRQQPTVLIQAVTLLPSATSSLLETALAPPDFAEPRTELVLALRPAALCLDPIDPVKPGVLVDTRASDGMGVPLFSEPAPLEAALSAQFGRLISIRIGCLP